MLAGVPQAPSRLSPRRNPEAAERRQDYVLSQLEAKREVYWPDLSEAAIAAAREEKVEPVPVPEGSGSAPEVLAIARRALRTAAGDEALGIGGYEVYTTIDLSLQRQARQALQSGLRAIDERQGYQGPFRRAKRRRGPRATEPINALRMGRTYIARVTGTDDENEKLRLDVAGHPAVLRMRDAARYNPGDRPASAFARKGDLLPVSITQVGARRRPGGRAPGARSRRRDRRHRAPLSGRARIGWKRLRGTRAGSTERRRRFVSRGAHSSRSCTREQSSHSALHRSLAGGGCTRLSTTNGSLATTSSGTIRAPCASVKRSRARSTWSSFASSR